MTTETTKTPSGWFTSEIQQMMFSSGDSREPLQETAELVEVIVHQQMMALLEQASDVAVTRGDKHIGIENIIFVLRKDKNKLKRLFRFFEIRDMKNKIKTLAEQKDDSGSHDLINISVLEKEAADKQRMSKDRKICYDFLCSIDQTGELLALFYDNEEDTVKHERMLRAEIRARGMSTEQYFKFCKARQASFSNFKKQFQEWIMLNFTLAIVPNTAVMEVLCYLAHETVAQIVDFALLVKQDIQAGARDPQNLRPSVGNQATEIYNQSSHARSKTTTDSSQIPLNNASSTSQIKSHSNDIDRHTSAALTLSKLHTKKTGPRLNADMSWDCAILPSDVREAMRRYYTDISPFVSQTKVNHHCSTWHRTFCS